MIYLDLIFNLSLLVTLSIVSGFIEKRWERKTRLCALLQGGLFGGAAVLGMLRPLDLGYGLIFDGRSIMVSLCGLFFGPLAVGVSAAMTVLARIALGGVGALMGVLVILSSAGIGLLARSRFRPEEAPPSAGRLYLFGLMVHASMVLLMLVLPGEVRSATLRRIGPPVILMYPLATILAGKILSDQVSAARTTASLRQAEERFRSFFDSAPIGKSISSPDGRFLRVNPALAAMLGYPAEEMKGLSIHDVTHPGDVAEGRGGHRMLADGKLGTLEAVKRLVGRDGRELWVHETTCLQRDADGNPMHLLTHLQDITEHKRAEDSLRESESRYRTLFDHGADGIVVLDPETTSPVFFNNQVCAQLGYAREEFAGIKVSDIELVESAEQIRARIRKILETGYDEFETLHRTRQGEQRNVHVKVQYIRSGGKPLYHCIWRDVTESKRAEAEREKLRGELQTAQRMEAVGTLAGGIAHDFNNALTGIFGFGEMVAERVAGDEQSRRDIEEVLRCADRAATLTRQLLMFARPQAIEPVDLDLNALVGSLRNLIAKAAGENIEIRCCLEEGLPAVRADRGQVEQVLMNLCLNARDAMPRGGTLRIGTRSEILEEGSVGWDPGLKKGAYVVLEVSDTGIGMDEKTRERVFEPFFTTKGPEKGTGLGLAMAYGIVRRHDGFINLYSEPGNGTTFKVHLPAVDALPESLPAGSQAEEALRGGTETILLADDEEPIRALAQRVLSDLGYDVVLARNGREAVEAFRRSGKVSLVVLDVVMPGKGGREAFEEMRREVPGLVAVFMSGYAGDALGDLLSSGDDRLFLQKPFGPTVLARRIREALDGRARERAQG